MKYYFLITAPPSMISLPIDQRSLSIMYNQPVKIVCPVTTSKHNSEIEWFKNGQKLDVTKNPFLHISSEKKILQLSRAHEDDGGHYECVVSNVAGRSSSDFNLQILGRIIITLISSPIYRFISCMFTKTVINNSLYFNNISTS